MAASRNIITASILFVSGILLTAMACASLFGVSPNRVPAIAAPLATAAPTDTAIPLYQQVALNSVPWHDDDTPAIGYTIAAQVPTLVGSSDPRVLAFNAEMKTIVDVAVATFKQNVSNIPLTPTSTESTFDLRYSLLSPPGNIFSIKFDIQTFYTGAAHPGDISQTANYDLQTGKNLELADLFIPGSDYLGALSNYCIAQLKTRDIDFQSFELGATPTLQNYRNWNITADGLVITFDEYQVAPYAAGPQTVVIPYSALAPIIQPNGPLASFVH